MSAQSWRNPDQFTQQLAYISSWKGHYVLRCRRHMNVGLKMHILNEPEFSGAALHLSPALSDSLVTSVWLMQFVLEVTQWWNVQPGLINHSENWLKTLAVKNYFQQILIWEFFLADAVFFYPPGFSSSCRYTEGKKWLKWNSAWPVNSLQLWAKWEKDDHTWLRLFTELKCMCFNFDFISGLIMMHWAGELYAVITNLWFLHHTNTHKCTSAAN